MVNWRTNNKCAIRNPNEAVDSHDVVKMLLMRMLRRKHSNSSLVQIESEAEDKDNGNFPDVRLIMKRERRRVSEIYNWEIQKNVSKKWIKEKNEYYTDADWILLDLTKIDVEVIEKTGKSLDEWIKILRNAIEKAGGII